MLSVLPCQKSPVDAFMRVFRVHIGPIKTAPLNILGYTVQSQAFSAPPSVFFTSRIRAA